MKFCWNERGVWSNVQQRCERLATVGHCRYCDEYLTKGRAVLERDWRGVYQEGEDEIASGVGRTRLNKQSYILFTLAGNIYALPVMEVNGVYRQSRVHRIPHNKSSLLLGFVAISGEVKVCLEMRSLLPAVQGNIVPRHNREPSVPRLLVITDKAGSDYVVAVDHVLGIFRHDELTEIPEQRRDENGLVRGHRRYADGREVQLLDLPQLVKQIQMRL